MKKITFSRIVYFGLCLLTALALLSGLGLDKGVFSRKSERLIEGFFVADVLLTLFLLFWFPIYIGKRYGVVNGIWSAIFLIINLCVVGLLMVPLFGACC